MTEEQAKTKWCPFVVSIEHEIDPYANRDSRSIAMMNHCEASDCMAWRWKNSPNDIDTYRTKCENEGFPPFPPSLIPTGYCGLVGRPE